MAFLLPSSAVARDGPAIAFRRSGGHNQWPPIVRQAGFSRTRNTGGTHPVTETLEKVRTYQQFIGGRFAGSAARETREGTNPAHYQPGAHVPPPDTDHAPPAVPAAAKRIEILQKT